MTVQFMPPFSTAIGKQSIVLDTDKKVETLEQLLDEIYRIEPNIELKLIQVGLAGEIARSIMKGFDREGKIIVDLPLAEKIVIYQPALLPSAQ